MFVWFAVALTLLRLLRVPARRAAVWPIAAATVAFALLALPTADFRSGMDQERTPVARAMGRAVVPAVYIPALAYSLKVEVTDILPRMTFQDLKAGQIMPVFRRPRGRPPTHL